MLLSGILQRMIESGYQTIKLNVDELYLLYKKDLENIDKYIFVADTSKCIQNDSQLESVINQLQSKLQERTPNCEILTIILTNQIDVYRKLENISSSVWFIDTNLYRLMIYENQKDGYKEIRLQIEEQLDSIRGTQIDSMSDLATRYGFWQEDQVKHKSVLEKIRSNRIQLPVCCTALVAVNAIIFLFMDLVLCNYEYGMIINRFGEKWSEVLNHGQIYRMFTAMFLHSGFDHVFNNMLVLYGVGRLLEKVLSKPKFLVIYFGSGIIAGLVSMGYNMINNRYVVCVGASGAIFGLVGAFAYIVLINKGRLQEMSPRQILLFVAFSLYGGFRSSNVDNAAHIGGFLAGVLFAVLMYRKPKREV